MSDAQGHDVVRDMLPMAALDALSPADRAALERHLTTCDSCTRELAELRDATASIATSLPQRPMPAEREAAMRARLLARAIEERENTPFSTQSPTPSRSSPLALSSPDSFAPLMPEPVRARRPWGTGWLAAAAVLIAAGSIAYAFSLRTSIAKLSLARAELRDSTITLHRRLAEQQAILDGLTGPGVRVIDAAAPGERKPYARMFWDQPTNRWTFVAYNLPTPAPGHTYQLWLVTRDQKKISAGVFDPTASGSAIVRATYPLAADSLAAIAVTTEPAGGSVQATTAPFLVGAVAKTE